MDLNSKNTKDRLVKRNAFIIFLFFFFGAILLWWQKDIQNDLEDISDSGLPILSILSEIQVDLYEQQTSFERLVTLDFNQLNKNSNNLLLAKHDSLFNYYTQSVNEKVEELKKITEVVIANTKQKVQNIKLKELIINLDNLKKSHQNFHLQTLLAIEAIKQGSYGMAKNDLISASDLHKVVKVQSSLIYTNHKTYSELLMKASAESSKDYMKWIVILSGLFSIFIGFLLHRQSHRVWSSLLNIKNGLQGLSQGLDKEAVKIAPDYLTREVTESFNELVDKIAYDRGETNQYMQFIYSAAHDLAIPATNMKSLLYMLKEEKEGSNNYQTILRNSIRSAEQLEKTILAITEVNRVRELLATEKELIDFDEITKEVVSQLFIEIKEVKATIKKDFADCEKVEFAPNLMKIMLVNLVSNSINYRDPERTLSIKIKTKLSGGSTTLIYQDNGLGFDSLKNQEEVLKPFVRLHAHTEGIGLGLYIIKLILDHLGGTIKIESEPRSGTTFLIRFN